VADERPDLIADYREFTRVMQLRFERALRAHRAEIRQSREENRRYFEALSEQHEREMKQLDEVIEENRAQRQALFRILDRLDGRGPATA
jgi:hypothetical protein